MTISARAIQSLCGLQNLIVNKTTLDNDTLFVHAQTKKKIAYCDVCNKASRIRRSSYTRKLSALAVAGYKMILLLKVFKYKCSNPDCIKKIFSQQVKDITLRYCRRTESLNKSLFKICIEVSANKAAYLSNIMNTPTSSSSCLRLIKKTDIPINQNCKAIGIDDWAKRKGVNYGSIIVNSQTHKTIDLINSRSESDIITWLSQNPSIEYVTRDRATFYTSAITKALPKAKQIADKFHLIKNLSDAIFEDLKSLSSMIRQVFQEGIIHSCIKQINNEEPRTADLIYQHETERRKAKLTLFQELKSQGLNITAIARRTGSNRDTVRNYLKNGYPKVKSKSTLNYDEYLDIISEMCNNQLNPSAMFRRLRDLGFKGCIKSFTGWFNSRFPEYKFKWNRDYIYSTNLKSRVHMPSYKKFTLLLLNPLYGICTETGEISIERQAVDGLVEKLPELKEMQTIYHQFRRIINGDSVSDLEDFCASMNNTELKRIFSFFNGLKKDWDAICNAIKYNWTNSLVEGCVNRLKSKKREMYGRAGFELLRRKVCLSVTG